MLPIQIEQRFRNPGLLEQQFFQYLRDAKLSTDDLPKTIAPVAFYQRASIAGVSRFNFFDSSNYVAGLTNLATGFVNPQGQHAVIYGIRLLTEVGAASPQVAAYIPGTSGDATIQNADLTVEVNGVTLIRKYPMAEFLSDLTTEDDGLVLLNEPIVWPAQTDLNAELVNTIGGNFTALANAQIELIGIGLVS